ncbi:glycerol-3-phosphate dehydrogenase/oxidase [Gemmatimonadota bacterium]
MDREALLRNLETTGEPWDVIVVGGGATGLGTAVEAASRGYRTLLLEQHDFSKGTSSRSTKLVHGGVRYLQQGNISLVIEALHERGLLMQNAPHLVRNQSFIVPSYEWWNGPFYGAGLKVYDLLAGRLGLGPSHLLSTAETLEHIPTLEPDRLHGGVIYHDGQFDDARLAVNLAQTVFDNGGTPLNYMRVTGLVKTGGVLGRVVGGVEVIDEETGEAFSVEGRVVVNATGIFTDEVRRMDDADVGGIIALSQGIHLVVDKKFLPGDSAIMVPHTDDGRVLFAVPWHDVVVVGTTDTPIEEATLEPRAFDEEVDFVLAHIARYLTRDPAPSDVLSVFAGIRPLVSPKGTSDTSSISRDHHVLVSPSGLVTITGGKWTTYRRMGEDTIDQAALVGGLEHRDSVTRDLHIHGWIEDNGYSGPGRWYGSDRTGIARLLEEQPDLEERLHPDLPYRCYSVVWGVRQEMARTVEDVLARRTRALLLNARASIEAAPAVAAIMARELDRDTRWQEDQIDAYTTLARGYLPA